MERKLDRKTLSFGKGMTNVPSDLLSDDTELAESNGFIYRNGEMKPVQEAKMVTGFGANGKLMYVHKSAGYKNLIGYNANNEIVCFIYDENEGIVFAEKKSQYFEIEGVTDVNSIGNTLLVATTNGIHYLLFKSGEYKDLGNELPRLTANFYFERPTGNYTPEETGRTLMNIDNDVECDSNAKSYFDAQGKFLGAGVNKPSSYFAEHPYGYFKIKVGSSGEHEKGFQETVQGHVAEAINWVKSKNMFAFPFFVRCAFRLFDGSYARITNPIICYPTINKNCRFSSANFDKKHNTFADLLQMMGTGSVFCFMEYKELFYLFGSIGEEWRDIVKEIVVFASEQVPTFYIDKGWRFVTPGNANGKPYMNSGVRNYEEKLYNYDEKGFDGNTMKPHDEIQPTYKSDKDIISELIHGSQFYKLFSVDAYGPQVGGDTYHSTTTGIYGDTTVIGTGVVENLTSQEQLTVDDYYGWTKTVAERMFTYNSRIHLIDAKRYPFSGFTKFVGRNGDSKDGSYMMYTHIASSTCDTWVSSSMMVNKSFLSGWLYYPDPNAKEIILWAGGKAVRIPLTTHPLLNGAYSFENLPSKDGGVQFEDISTEEIQKILEMLNIPETLNSQIFTSVVNNPFVFEASGDNTVGTGKILGIAANTEAVSQGQHGYAPLIVFTTEGMYALKTNSEGLYVGVDPLPREVCNNADSITPIDNYVIFAADKGLMAATGGSAACLSEQMRGRTPRNFATMGCGRFLDFLKNCLIAYDYRDSILRIFKKSNGYTEDGDVVEDEKYYYIYDLANKTFSMGKLNLPVKAVVNDYPDNLIQDISGYVYSLAGKPDVNDDETLYSGGFTTRPLKLGGSMTLKSIRAIKHLYDTDEGKVKLEVYASNDCKHWVKLTSLGGKPWKYFTFKYTLTDFKACDSFAGSIVEIQNRREDKIR